MLVKKFTRFLLVFVCPLFMSGCGFHLRGQNILPPNLHCIKIESATPYGDLESTIRLKLTRLGANITRTGQAPYILHILSKSLYCDVPTIGGSNQARVYVYYYQVTFNLLDENHNVLLPNKCVRTSQTLIVNAGTTLGATNQLIILQHEMQAEVAHMILNILISPQVFQLTSG
jgi:LPS-assembly lipoprotein